MISPEILRRFPYFAAAGEEVLKALAEVSEEIVVPEDGLFFRDGDKPKYLFVLLSGSVDIMLTLGSSREVIVDTVVAGDLMGWSSVSGASRRVASAQAVKETRAVQIDAAELRALMLENDAFGRHMMTQVVQILSHRLGSAWAQLASV